MRRIRGLLLAAVAMIAALVCLSPFEASQARAAAGATTIGFDASSFTAVSTGHWWLLGVNKCGASRCARLLTTTDAGASFASLPVPDSQLGRYASAPAVVFANAEDGWLYGPRLWATEDGGHHWTQVKLPGTVTALAAGAGDAFAIVDPPEPACYKTGHCISRATPKEPLYRVKIGSNGWSADPATETHGASTGLAVHGDSVWVIDTDDFGDGLAIGQGLLHSSNSGQTFSPESQGTGGLGCLYSPVSDTVVWDYCSGGHFMDAGRSTDAGEHFHAVGPELPKRTTPNGYPNGSVLAAASPETAVATSDIAGKSSLIETRNAGASWWVVHPSFDRHGYWKVLGFTTPTVGYGFWIELSGVQLWRTTDAGANWSRDNSLP